MIVRLVLMLVLLVPNFALAETIFVPAGHFLGISAPCRSVSEARRKAIEDVVAQVLRFVGAEYSLSMKSSIRASGEAYSYDLDQRFSYKAKGFLSELERMVVSEHYDRTASGVVYRVLVKISKPEIDQLRRLSLGANVIANFVGSDRIRLEEVNGVPVTLTHYIVRVKDRNTHAGFLSYYVMHVSSGSSDSIRRAFDAPIRLGRGQVQVVKIEVPGSAGLARSVLLGTKRSVVVEVIGTDQVGRPVRVRVQAR